MKKGMTGAVIVFLLTGFLAVRIMSTPGGRMIGINVVLNADISTAHLAELGRYGKIRDVVPQIKAVTLQAPESSLEAIRKLPFVLAAGPDAERSGVPIDTVLSTDFADGLSTWDLDAVNVTNFGVGREITQDGTGVYVAVLDTGLLDSWRQYFPQERIAVEYAKSFGGGGGNQDNTSEQPNKWEHDQNSHGTHVTSTILGYNLWGDAINGVAPMSRVIPVKVLNQPGFGWSSVIARGIVYIADLKAGALAGFPIVINMSLGGLSFDPLEKAAIDYAIGKGVIIVASAGNKGSRGMDYPAAYNSVISVAASGWVEEWTSGSWWREDVADPINPADFYIGDFSARALSGQDLDVAAPGTWVLGPYQMNSGQISYYFLGGTSMASPHVAGIVALMAQKDPTLTPVEAESLLVSTAVSLGPGSRSIFLPNGAPAVVTWGSDATGAGLVDAAAAIAAIL